MRTTFVHTTLDEPARSATDMLSVTSTSSMIDDEKSPITRSMSGCTDSRWNSGRFSRNRLCADQFPIVSAKTAASATAGVTPAGGLRRPAPASLPARASGRGGRCDGALCAGLPGRSAAQVRRACRATALPPAPGRAAKGRVHSALGAVATVAVTGRGRHRPAISGGQVGYQYAVTHRVRREHVDVQVQPAATLIAQLRVTSMTCASCTASR